MIPDALLYVALTALVACSGEPKDTVLTPCEEAALTPATVEVGTGSESFEPFAEGDTVGYVLGPQGGFHVWGSLRVTGMVPGDPTNLSDPENATVTYQVLYANGDLLGGFTELPRGFTPVEGDASTYEIIGETLLIAVQGVDGAEGEAVAITATVTDSCGTTVTDSRAVTLTYAGEA